MSSTSTLSMICLIICFFALCLARVEGATNTTCPGECAPCVGGDSGGCCGMFIEFANKTYCDPYCMVSDYHCCGCAVVNVTTDIFECYSCPNGQECLENWRHQNPLPNNQTGWYCASGSALSPSSYLFTLALALLLFLAFADSFVSAVTFLDGAVKL